MYRIKRLIQERLVGIFFLVVFAIPWLPAFFIVAPKFLRGELIELLDIGMIGLAMFDLELKIIPFDWLLIILGYNLIYVRSDLAHQTLHSYESASTGFSLPLNRTTQP